MKKILCFGDSNVFGFIPGSGMRYDKNSRWSGILKKLSSNRFEIIEEGCNNRTGFLDNPSGIMQTGYKILPSSLSPDLDGIVLAIGINDLQFIYNASFSQLEEGIENLIKIVSEVCPKSKIIFAAPSVLTEDVLKGYFSTLFDESSIEKSYKLSEIYKSAALKHNCYFIDFNEFAKVSELDGLHYSEEEHAKIANQMYELLCKIFN